MYSFSGSTNSHYTHGPSMWGGHGSINPLAASLGDSLSQSRPQYQPGYMMSSSPENGLGRGSQRLDDAPLVQTKAKINHLLLRGSASDFGMDSMFESPRQRQLQILADEDAPPSTSVTDIPTELRVEPHSSRFQLGHSPPDSPQLQRRQPRTPPSISRPSPALYVIVFGYPQDRYTLAVEYFKSLGQSTEPNPNTEITNCFKIGYFNPTDAIRAVRKNGEVIGGSCMIGAKWADIAQAEALLGQLAVRGTLFGAAQQDDTGSSTSPDATSVNASPSSQIARTANSAVGTPIQLAPSTSAFRVLGTLMDRQQQHGTHLPSTTEATGSPNSGQQPPSKGVIGRVSDLIFGW